MDDAGRLEYLDSLRGIAALYVAVGHVLVGIDRANLRAVARGLAATLDEGRLSVALFIVLSGYCLMLPVARSGRWVLRNGFPNYLFRRARRIYPPYLAAMAVSLGFIAILPPALSRWSFWLTTFKPAFTPGVLLSHVFMVHNLSNAWLCKINAPFWSVATEWQIYFLFPMLLWLSSRVGLRATVLAALGMSLAPIYVFRRFETAAPWFLCLFAMGMVAATVVHSPLEKYARYRQRKGWGWVSLAATVALVVGLVGLAWYGREIGWKRHLLSQLVLGAAVATGLVWLGGSGSDGAARARRVLHSRPLVGLGRISYSLYLTHAIPICAVGIGVSMVGHDWPVWVRFVVAAGVGGVLSVVVAALFYFPFERPFLNIRQEGGQAGVTRTPARPAEAAAIA